MSLLCPCCGLALKELLPEEACMELEAARIPFLEGI